jgi:multicomponent Na+:H+ antiporter subunit B
MSPLFLRTTTRLLMPLMLMISLVLLLRGHYEPGGGFVGGLVAGASFVLFAYSEGVAEARRTLRASPMGLLAGGLLVAIASGLIGLLSGGSFLTGVWTDVRLPAIGRLGTPLLFDVGVYIVVLGTVTGILFALLEADE